MLEDICNWTEQVVFTFKVTCARPWQLQLPPSTCLLPTSRVFQSSPNNAANLIPLPAAHLSCTAVQHSTAQHAATSPPYPNLYLHLQEAFSTRPADPSSSVAALVPSLAVGQSRTQSRLLQSSCISPLPSSLSTASQYSIIRWIIDSMTRAFNAPLPAHLSPYGVTRTYSYLCETVIVAIASYIYLP